jgi:hypothetical protein
VSDISAIVQAAGATVLGVLGWSLRANIRAAMAAIASVQQGVDTVATDVRQLSASVGEHGRLLAAGDVEIRQLKESAAKADSLRFEVAGLGGRLDGVERSVDGLEERERQCPGRLRAVKGG